MSTESRHRKRRVVAAFVTAVSLGAATAACGGGTAKAPGAQATSPATATLPKGVPPISAKPVTLPFAWMRKEGTGKGWVITSLAQLADLPASTASSIRAAVAVEKQYLDEAWLLPMQDFKGDPAKGIPPAHVTAAGWAHLAIKAMQAGYFAWSGCPASGAWPAGLTAAEDGALGLKCDYDLRIWDVASHGWADEAPGATTFAHVESFYAQAPKGVYMPLYVVAGTNGAPNGVYVPFGVSSEEAPAVLAHTRDPWRGGIVQGWTEMFPQSGGWGILYPAVDMTSSSPPQPGGAYFFNGCRSEPTKAVPFFFTNHDLKAPRPVLPC